MNSFGFNIQIHILKQFWLWSSRTSLKLKTLGLVKVETLDKIWLLAHCVDPTSYLADMKNDIVVPVPGMVPEILTGAWNEMVASKKFHRDACSHRSLLCFHPVICNVSKDMRTTTRLELSKITWDRV